MAEKQILRVLSAVEAGCETSDQVSAYTGLPLPHCSKWLGDLVKDGLIVKTYNRALKIRIRGPSMHRYGPKVK